MDAKAEVCRPTGAAVLASLALAIGPSPAPAAVTVGQLAPGTAMATGTCSSGSRDLVGGPVSSGVGYSVPPIGASTSLLLRSWTHNASSDPSQDAKLKVWRKVGEPNTYRVIGQNGPHALDNNGTANNTFTAPGGIPVLPGDWIGLTAINADFSGEVACSFPAPGQEHLAIVGSSDLADGAQGNFTPAAGRLNVIARVEPVSDFSIGKVTRNKKKGTATVALTLPNPGELNLFSKEAKAADAVGATAARSVPAGAVQFKIKAKGERKRRLNEKGKVKVDLTFDYTPSGGELPEYVQKRVKLTKN